MLYPHRALEFASPAGGALKCSLFVDMAAQQRRFPARAELVQVTANPKHDFLWVQNLSGVVRRTMLGAAAALDASECLQGVHARDIFAGVEAEVLVALERRYAAEALPAQEHRHRAERQVQVLGVRNQRQKRQQRQRVQPPVHVRRVALGQR